jgi:outer membrane protein OmpA-like peptidoglycan-associated protein
MLSACSGTVQMLRDDFDRATGRAEPALPPVPGSRSGLFIPQGYTGPNHRMVLKPPGMEQSGLKSTDEFYAVPVPPPQGGTPEWQDLGSLDGQGAGVQKTDTQTFDEPAAAPAHEWRAIGSLDAAPADDLAPVTSDSAVVVGGEPAFPPYGGQQYNDAVRVFPLDGDDGYTPSYAVSSYAYGRLVQKIYFAHASAAIPAGDRRKLGAVARGLDGQGDSVTVVGHASHRVDGVTDPVRRQMINLKMAQKRADSVTRVLKDAGVNPGWVQAVSRGDEEPNAEPGDMTQEAADRRVEVFVNGQ